jgi:hypothetical protein
LFALFITVIVPHGFDAEEERSIRFFLFFVIPPFGLFSYATMVQDMERRYHDQKVSLGTVYYWMAEAIFGQWIADKLWRISPE